MESEPLPRKLAAILYADVADYSRLTGGHEEGTHRSYLNFISSRIREDSGISSVPALSDNLGKSVGRDKGWQDTILQAFYTHAHE